MRRFVLWIFATAMLSTCLWAQAPQASAATGTPAASGKKHTDSKSGKHHHHKHHHKKS